MDPNPFKHPAVILGKIHDAIAPSLDRAGYTLDGRNNPSTPIHLYIDYRRGNDLFRLSWDRRDSDQFIGFVAEIIRDPDMIETIEERNLSYIAKLPRVEQVTSEVETQINEIAESIDKYLSGLSDS